MGCAVRHEERAIHRYRIDSGGKHAVSGKFHNTDYQLKKAAASLEETE
jgi:hypothetical protein